VHQSLLRHGYCHLNHKKLLKPLANLRYHEYSYLAYWGTRQLWRIEYTRAIMTKEFFQTAKYNSVTSSVSGFMLGVKNKHDLYKPCIGVHHSIMATSSMSAIALHTRCPCLLVRDIFVFVYVCFVFTKEKQILMLDTPKEKKRKNFFDSLLVNFFF